MGVDVDDVGGVGADGVETDLGVDVVDILDGVLVGGLVGVLVEVDVVADLMVMAPIVFESARSVDCGVPALATCTVATSVLCVGCVRYGWAVPNDGV